MPPPLPRPPSGPKKRPSAPQPVRTLAEEDDELSGALKEWSTPLTGEPVVMLDVIRPATLDQAALPGLMPAPMHGVPIPRPLPVSPVPIGAAPLAPTAVPARPSAKPPSVEVAAAKAPENSPQAQAQALASAPAEPVPEEPPVTLFRPTRRPPTPMLLVMDDGRADGETIRVRSTRFVIGRTDGDLTIPFDALIAERHAEIAYEEINGTKRWVINDLSNTSGLFLRVRRVPLKDGDVLLIGGGRYVFDQPETEHAIPGIAECPEDRPPVRLPLMKAEYWIGSDASCDMPRTQDPFASARHVRLCREEDGSWYAVNNQSPNGLWIRVSKFVVKSECNFQIGEQRFRLSV